MLNKTKIIITAVTIAVVGTVTAYATYTITQRDNVDALTSSAVSQEASSMAVSKADTTVIDNAVSQGKAEIQQETSRAIQEIQAAKQSDAQSRASETSSISTPKKTLKVDLNFSQKNDYCTTIIKTAEISYEYGYVYFDYELPITAPESGTHKLCESIGDNATLTEKNGTVNKCEGYGLTQMWFYVSDPEDLSPMTLNYTHRGGDPVTVTFDIPIE